MKSWAAEAVKITTDLTQRNQTIIEGIKKVTALFAEPPSTKSEDFFGMISTFISGIEQANIANNKRKAEEAAAQKKLANAKQVQPARLPSPLANSERRTDETGFDSIIKSYKNGSFLPQ